MSFNAKKLQVFAKVPGGYGEGEEYRLIEHHPALRLHGEHAEYPVYIQDGEVWAESGDRVLMLPSWFWTEVRKCSPSALLAVGWDQEPPPVPTHEAMPVLREGARGRLRKRLQEQVDGGKIMTPSSAPLLGMLEEADGHDHSNN